MRIQDQPRSGIWSTSVAWLTAVALLPSLLLSIPGGA
jgi:hypothetical protein